MLGEEGLERRQSARVDNLAVVEGPHGSGAIAVAVRRESPLARTSAAATLPASISRPTRACPSSTIFWKVGVILGSCAGGGVVNTQSTDFSAQTIALQRRRIRKDWKSVQRLAADDPGGLNRFQEVGRLHIAKAVVVDVVLGVASAAVAAVGTDRAAEFLRDRTVDGQRTQRSPQL